jgi:sugar phosphate permease
MVKATPSFGRILGMLAFTASCVGILIYLWLTFGGADPPSPRGLPTAREVR